MIPRIVKWLLIIFALVMGLLNPSQSFAQESAPVIVTVAKVKQQDVSTKIWLTGNVISREQADIASEGAGRIEWIADIGEFFKQGEVIAKVDHQLLELQLRQQQARLQRLEAQVNYFTQHLNRLQTLVTLRSSAQNDMEVIQRDLTVAQSDAQELQWAIQHTELQIKKTEIKAPFNGVTSEQSVKKGEYVQAGQTLLHLVNLSSLDIDVKAPLGLAQSIGQQRRVTIEYENQQLSLPIRTWVPAGQSTTRSFELRINADGQALLPGMAVNVALPKNDLKSALLVPRDALVLRENETYIVRINSDNVAEKIAVTTGVGDADWIQVHASVFVNDNIVTRGAEKVKDGDLVTIDS